MYSSYNWKYVPFDQHFPISSTSQLLTNYVCMPVTHRRGEPDSSWFLCLVLMTESRPNEAVVDPLGYRAVSRFPVGTMVRKSTALMWISLFKMTLSPLHPPWTALRILSLLPKSGSCHKGTSVCGWMSRSCWWRMVMVVEDKLQDVIFTPPVDVTPQRWYF